MLRYVHIPLRVFFDSPVLFSAAPYVRYTHSRGWECARARKSAYTTGWAFSIWESVWDNLCVGKVKVARGDDDAGARLIASALLKDSFFFLPPSSVYLTVKRTRIFVSHPLSFYSNAYADVARFPLLV